MAKFDLSKYKDSIKQADVPLKKDLYIEVNDALQEVLGLKGVPLGHVTQMYGPSDSGKSTLGFHIAAQAQKQGILPIFIITENKVSWDRAKAMGVDTDNIIIDNVEYVEDIFKRMDLHLSRFNSGDLPVDIVFIVDSIGNTISVDSIKFNKDGTSETGGAMMKVAKVLREQMRTFSHKINNTRKVSSPKTAGLVFINHSYTKPPAFPGAMSTQVPYGGDGIWYSASLVISTKKVKKLEATKDGMKLKFAMISKLSIEKNHISDVSNSGEFVIAADSIFPNEKGAIEDYKTNNRDKWGSMEIEEGNE